MRPIYLSGNREFMFSLFPLCLGGKKGMSPLKSKCEALAANLRSLGNVAVAFSSGVDSTFLLKTVHELLGEQTLAVTVRSCLFPDNELDEAVHFVRREKIRHVVLDFDPLSIAGFAQNPADRCYLCKTELFTRIRRLADERNIPHVIEGSNVDDSKDYRPGMRALTELGILSPLRESGLTKQDIRQLSQAKGLPTWNKPSLACLASRIPYGEEIVAERLEMIDAAERYLLSLGFRLVRVRSHNNVARIEMEEEGLQRLVDKDVREIVYARFKALGFVYVTLDLQGYRTGSMNEIF